MAPVAARGAAAPPGSARAALARRVADAVSAVPGVARLVAGSGIEVATQHAGGRVLGVRLGDPVALCLVVDELQVRDVCDRARAAAREVLAETGRSPQITVTVADIDDRALSRRGARESATAGQDAVGQDAAGQGAAGQGAAGRVAPWTAVHGTSRMRPMGGHPSRPVGAGRTGAGG